MSTTVSLTGDHVVLHDTAATTPLMVDLGHVALGDPALHRQERRDLGYLLSVGTRESAEAESPS